MSVLVAQNYSFGDNGANDSTLPFCDLDCLRQISPTHDDYWIEAVYEFDERCAYCGTLIPASR